MFKPEPLFRTRCLNAFPSYTQFLFFKIPVRYKRKDLNQWAKEARKNGRKHFFCDPVDFDNLDGEWELTEPRFGYVIPEYKR